MIREFHAFFIKLNYYYARKSAGGEGCPAPTPFLPGRKQTCADAG
jgi:hypothetical protein